MAEEEKTGGGPEDLDYDRSEAEETQEEGGPDDSGPLEANLDGTITMMHKLLQSKLSEIDAGTASLTPETLTLIDKLVSLSSSRSGSDSSSPKSASSSLVETFAEALSSKPKRVVITSQDVKQVPRLTGAADVDVISCLSQYRLVCSFRVKACVSSNMSDVDLVKLTDEAAFEHLSLICDGPVLLLYQHIMDGSIQWNSPGVSTDVPNAPGSYTAPKTWSELKTALLDCLMPSNSVEESATRLATLKMDPDESVASYALRFQNECSRFEACVQRATPGRSPYAALSIVLFRNGVVPGIKLLASQEPHPKTMPDAVAQLRRLEAANLTGLNPGRAEVHASAVSFTHVPNRSAIAQQYGAIDRKHAAMDARSKVKSRSGGQPGEGRSGGATSRPGGDGGGGGSSSGGGNRGGGSSRPSRRSSRPFCTYPHCEQPVGHYYERCFQRRRDEEAQAKKDGKATAERTGTGGAKRAKKTDGNDE